MLSIFANVFDQLLAGHLETFDPKGDDPENESGMGLLTDRFRTFPASCISLLSLITGGDDWYPSYDAFSEIPAGGIIFVFYIAGLIIGVLNVIAAVFVEAAINKAKADHTLTLSEQSSFRQEMAQELVRTFQLIDFDGSGRITAQEWLQFLESQPGKDFLILFDVEASQAKVLYNLLDNDNSGEISVEELVVGIVQMEGHITRLDFKKLEHRLKTIIENDKHLIRSNQALEAMITASAMAISTTPLASGRPPVNMTSC